MKNFLKALAIGFSFGVCALIAGLVYTGDMGFESLCSSLTSFLVITGVSWVIIEVDYNRKLDKKENKDGQVSKRS